MEAHFSWKETNLTRRKEDNRASKPDWTLWLQAEKHTKSTLEQDQSTRSKLAWEKSKQMRQSATVLSEQQDEDFPVVAVFAHGNQAAPMGTGGGLARVETAEHQPSKLEIKS
jgi:hypothetical protein